MKTLLFRIILFYLIIISTESLSCGIPPSFGKIPNINKRESFTNKIINGIDVLLGHHPWIVKLVYSYPTSCTGTIISRKFIITAKHCITKELEYVGYGDVEADEMSKIKIKETYYLGNLGVQTYGQDIALIELVSPLVFNDFVAPICLSFDSELQYNEIGIISGFGYDIQKVSQNKVVPKDVTSLKYNKIKRISDDYCKCNCNNNYNDIYVESEFCAGGKNTGILFGDSGGPLMKIQGNKWVLSGIISRSKLDIIENTRKIVFDKGIYTNVSFFCDFIKQHTNGEVKCF